MLIRQGTDDRADSFDALIRPLSARSFLADIVGKSPLCIRGRSNRFVHLLTWSSLNSALAEHPVGSLSIRLMNEGREIPQNLYTQHLHSEFLGYQLQLHVGKVTECLQQGATLVVNRFRELHGPTRALSNSLEAVFSSYVEVVVFASWNAARGLGTHWDPEETFILQLEGAKHWRIWPPTRNFPLLHDDVPELPAHTELYWEGDLHTGDLLHIPRGWWHDATPVNGPSLHVTLAVRPPTALDLAASFFKEAESLRQNIPLLANAAEQAEYVASFRSTIHSALERVSFLRFFADRDARAPARTSLSLPWNAVPEHDLPDRTILEWQPRRNLFLEECDGELRLRASGTTYKFGLVAKEVLSDLMEARSTTIKALCERHPRADVRKFVTKLISHGLVAAI